MLPTTYEAVKAVLRADPSIHAPERNQLLNKLRQGPETAKAEPPSAARIIRRAEAASRLGVGLRTLDKLSRSGVLPKRKLPNRVRAAGILETDLNALIAGKVT